MGWGVSYGLLFALLRISFTSAQCGSPQTFSHATPESSDISSPVGTELVYHCNAGYEFITGSNSHTVECLAGNSWEVITDCERVYCPVFPGDVVTDPSNAIQFGDVVELSCPDMNTEKLLGAKINEKLSVTCTSNKTWDNWDGEITDGCLPIECVNPLDAHSVGDSADTARYTSVSFTCDTGYLYSDGSSTKLFTCNADAEWESGGNTNWSCIPQPCADLRSMNALEHVALEPNTSLVGVEVTLTCHTGYTFPDSSVQVTALCYGNQTWSIQPVDCEPKVCPEIFNVSNANASTTDNWYPTEVNFTCFPSFTFLDGSTVRSTQCNQYGRWSEVIPPCGEPLEVDVGYQEVSVDAEGAQSFGIVALSIIGVIIVLLVAADALTFGMQLAVLKENLKYWQKKDDDLVSLDGEEMMKASTVSLGRGRITPAASTVDLQYPEKFTRDNKLSNAVQEVEIVNEERLDTEVVGKKNLIPRTRLTSAKTHLQKAVQSALTVQSVKKKMTTIVRKLNFNTAALPLGANNYGHNTNVRPPSPVKEDNSDSEYYSDDSDED